ncbi:MAG: hypothetical protein HKP30_03430 [Myxococcales bacterium]|nr:hypothetical protein [Myxococcales bacterium]
MRTWTLMLAMAVLLLPGRASAFSFGTFAPGDTIISIELSAAGISGVAGVVFDTGSDPLDPSDDTLTFESSVSTIKMLSGAEFTVPLGDVIVSSVVSPLAGSEFFSTVAIGADMANGIVADLSILDIGPGGAGMLLEADYIGAVSFTASQFFSGFPISGSLSGDFGVTGGDADFTTAFGPQGDFFGELAGWLLGTSGSGTAPSSLCDLTAFGTCAFDFASFTANPTTTITPVAVVPEPAAALLFACGIMGLAVLKR